MTDTELIKHIKTTIKARKITQIEFMVLQGIISGDGDIGGRMASSSPHAKPPVNDAQRAFLQSLADAQEQLGESFDVLKYVREYIESGWQPDGSYLLNCYSPPNYELPPT